MIWKNKTFLQLNAINDKTSSYGSKGNLKSYHHWSYPKLRPGIVNI